MGASRDGATELPGELILHKSMARSMERCNQYSMLLEREKQDIGEVNKALSDFIIDSKDHVDCMQKKPVHEVHTNQKMKFMKLAEVCKRMQMPERIPDKYSRAINFLAVVDDDTFRKLERIPEDADSINDADNDYDIRKDRKTVPACRN